MKKFILYVLSIILIILIIILFALQSGFLYPKIKLYFFKTKGHHAVLISIQKKSNKYLLTTNEKIQYAIEELLKGPDKKEKKLNYFSFIPSGTLLNNIEIKNNIAYLDFNKKIESGGGIENMEGRLSQIVFTTTQFPQIKKVRFLINGKEIKSFSGEGLTDVDKPLGRNNMKKILP
ncbi:MAG: GerMN domain-containing protein [Candidatus Omnitrophica bacterium]|jgi:spore germination protein GerM|nr:GerMN domain-containing protein [Candidatus Omnitrophota bacterium]